jgi:polysaccharide export outer membrane protein
MRGHARSVSAILFAVSGMVILFGCSGSTRDIPLREEVVLEQETFSFTPPDFRILRAYKISPGDQLDVLFQIQTWERSRAYELSLGDTVTVKFTKLPDLNESQKIRPDGTISLPYLGLVQAHGKNLQELSNELRERYGAIMRDPDVYVTVPEYLTQIREMKEDLHTASRGLSRLVTVRPDGYVTFPMAGDVLVAGKTIPQVKDFLNSKYRDISESLAVDLFLERHSGAMVYILGEVTNPGAFPITKAITVAEALALADGTSEIARLDHIMVVRRHENKLVGTRVDLERGLSFEPGGNGMFYLLPEDIVFVPKSRLGRIAELSAQLQQFLMFRGWNVGWSGSLHDEPLFGPTVPGE